MDDVWYLDHAAVLFTAKEDKNNNSWQRRSKMLSLNTINPAMPHDEKHFKQRMEAVDTQIRDSLL